MAVPLAPAPQLPSHGRSRRFLRFGTIKLHEIEAVLNQGTYGQGSGMEQLGRFQVRSAAVVAAWHSTVRGGIVRRKLLFASAAGALVVAAFIIVSNGVRVAASPASPAASNACDRACLNGLIDQYLAAMVKHDPSHLPLAKTVKFTEDGVRLELGRRALGDGIRPEQLQSLL